MTSTEVLLSQQYLGALFIYSVIAPALIFLTFWLSSLANDYVGHEAWAAEFNHWSTQHIWVPLARIVSIILFTAMTFPIMFGIEEPISFARLIGSERINTLINAMFLMGVIVPLLPIIGRLHSLVIPLQSLAASQLIFIWLSELSGQETVNSLPSISACLQLCVLMVACHVFASKLSSPLGRYLDNTFNVDGCGELVFQSMLVWLQGPILLVYTVDLGQQLIPFQ